MIRFKSPVLPLIVVLSLVANVSLVGCGGGGGAGGGTRPAQIAAGKVTVPTGFPLKPSDLFVEAQGDREPVSQNGSFRVALPNTGETLVTLQDATGDVLMLGYADSGSSGSAEAGGHGQISAATTATALLFYGVSGYTLPSTAWSTLTAYIASSTQCRQVASVVAARLDASATALASDAQITTAVLSGAAGLAAGHLSPSFSTPVAKNASMTVSVVRSSASGTSTSGNAVLVQPSSVQSGVEVLNNPTGDGIVFVNHLRRRCEAFIYETAKQAPGGSLENINPVIQTFTQPSLAGTIAGALQLPLKNGDCFDIQPSNSLHGELGAIIDAAFGSGAFTAANSGPIVLPLDGNTVRTDYEIVVVGPAFQTDGDLTNFPVFPGFTSFRAEWQSAITVLNWEEFLLDIAIPVIASVPLGPKFKPFGVDPGPILDIVNAVANVPDLVTQINNGRLKDATNTVLQNTADAGAVREAILKALWTSTFSAGTFEEQFEIAEKELQEFFFVQSILDGILQLIDSSVVFKDSDSQNAAEAWTASVLQAKATLSPSPATVNTVQNIAILTAGVQDVSDLSQFRFQWSTTGTEGTLQEPHAAIAMPPGPTQFTQAAYVADLTKIKAGQFDTVTVTVFNVSNINQPLASTSVRVIAQPSEEFGSYGLDSSEDFTGLVTNDPWVLSAVATVPLVSGATQYIVELKDASGNQLDDFFIDVSNGVPQVLDGGKEPWDHVLIESGVVKIAAFGVDAANAAVKGAATVVQDRFPVASVDIFYQ